MRKFLIFKFISFVDFIGFLMMRSEKTYVLLFLPIFDSLKFRIGIWRAWKNFERAYNLVPAYKKYIDSKGPFPIISLSPTLIPDLSTIPEMDKENYIKKFSNEDRVVGGKLPEKGVMIDESSGSSGKPTSWVRGPAERRATKRMLQLSFKISQQGKRVFVINAFALGAWATGLNVSISLSDITILKSTGPDMDKIVNTLLEFGPSYYYVIMGYPPFLKTLAEDKRIDWDKYTISSAYGGEGISESIRDYLLTKYKRVIGSYGASDLEINMAAENDFTIALRRLILESEDVRKALINPSHGVTPMVFQYNPLVYYLETNEKGELIVTICRPYNIAPKIRYNIHDMGHAISFSELKKRLEPLDVWKKLEKNNPLQLPILFFYGRSDMSIDYYGANVTPEGLREALFSVPEIASSINTFKLSSAEDTKHNKKMIVDVELENNKVLASFDKEKIAKKVFEKMANINRDFYNAYFNTASSDNLPVLNLHLFGKGPFEGGQKKLKNEYIVTKNKYDTLK